MNNLEQCELDLAIGKIKLFHHTSRSTTRVLCLHGWRDNRASFLPIMPFLQGIEFAAVDMMGHGESSHRDVNSLNHYIDYVRDIKLILDALGWEQCHILGHSMGGAVGLLAASALSERIQSLAMIDILHPSTRAEKDGPNMLKKALHQFAGWDKDRQQIFPSLELAVKTRLRASPFPQTQGNAQLIMEYATEKLAAGYRIRNDARLGFPSSVMLSRAQLNAFIQTVEQPVLAIIATNGMIQGRTDNDDTLALFQNIKVKHIEGGHHVHMENPKATSEAYLEFLKQF